MFEAWTDRIAQGLSRDGLGTVLCLGRAHHDILNALPEGAAEQIVQLEPIPEHAENLSRKAPDGQRILACAFGPADGPGTLHHFTMKSLASLRPATGLGTLFPGLRDTDTTEVQIWSAATLMTQLTLSDISPNLLILGAPGEEAEAITQFAELGALSGFEYVITPLPRLALYDGAADGSTLAAKLEANGFREMQRNETDPDQPVALLQRDRVWHALTAERDALRQELQDAQAHKAEAAETKRAYDEIAQHCDALQQALDTAKTQNKAQTKEAQNAQDALVAERDALQQALDAAKSKKARQLERAYDDIITYRTALRRKQKAAETEQGEDPGTHSPKPQDDMLQAELAQKELERLEAQLVIFQSLLVSEGS